MAGDGSTFAPKAKRVGKVLGWTAFGLSQIVLLPLTVIAVLGLLVFPLAVLAGTANIAVRSPESLTFHVDWAPWTILGCLVLSVALALVSRRDGFESRVALAPLAAAAVVFAWAGLSYNSRRVERYCSYGAVSQAQLDGCRDHVHVGDFADSDTPAARYGMYRSDECGDGAGSFCRGTRSGSGGFFRSGGFFDSSHGGF